MAHSWAAFFILWIWIYHCLFVTGLNETYEHDVALVQSGEEEAILSAFPALSKLDLLQSAWSFANLVNNSVCATQSPQELQITAECGVATDVHSSYFQSFEAFHRYGNRHPNRDRVNFEQSFMLFRIKVEISIYREVLDAITAFIDEVADRAQATHRPTLNVQLMLEGFIDDQMISLNNSYDAHRLLAEPIIDLQSLQSQFAFETILPWALNFQPNRSLVFSLVHDTRPITSWLTDHNASDGALAHWAWLQTFISITFTSISVEYVQQPSKFRFDSDQWLRTTQALQQETIRATLNRDVCKALGSPCAVVLQRIKRHLLNVTDTMLEADGDRSATATATASVTATAAKAKLFCGVFVTGKSHTSRLPVLWNTWAHKCDGFLAFSTETNLSIPAIALPHFGEERYGNMWQKSRSIWKYIHTFYREDFDWFLMGGDDMYHIVEHLRAFLTSEEMRVYQQQSEEGQRGVYLGRRLTERPTEQFEQTTYAAGGPGYILDRKALDVLATNIDAPHCHPYIRSHAEDVFIAECLAHSQPSITPMDTRDALHRQRFLQYPVGLSFHYGEAGYWPEHKSTHWLAMYDRNVSGGHDCCADSLIAIHSMNTQWMYAIDDFLFRCPRHLIDEYYDFHGSAFTEYSYEVVEPNERSY